MNDRDRFARAARPSCHRSRRDDCRPDVGSSSCGGSAPIPRLPDRDTGVASGVSRPPHTRYDLRSEPRYHFHCATCGAFSDLPIESFVLKGDAGHELHELSIVAEGVCKVCVQGGRLARASTASLRLLTSYLAVVSPAALEAAELLPAGASREPACVRGYLALAALLRRPHLRGALDVLLDARLGTFAMRFADASLSTLAEAFVNEAGQWPRETLLALLWTVVRRGDGYYEPLEQRVANALGSCGAD